jgi:hypothetical protein
LDLGGPLVYLHLREDALLDEQPLRGRSPALVVREVAVVGERLYGAAVLVGGLDALLAQRRADGVGYALPVLRLADPRVHGVHGVTGPAGSPPVPWGPDTAFLTDLEDFLDGRPLDQLLDVLL